MEESECVSSEKYQKYFKLLSDFSSPTDEEIPLIDLGHIVHNLDAFLSSHSNDLTSRSHVVSRLVEIIVSFGSVPSSNSEFDRDFDHWDFVLVRANAEICFQYLKILLNEIPQLDNSGKKRFFTHIISLCATHNRNYAWSNAGTTALSKDILSDLLNHTEHKSLSTLLCDSGFHPTIFKCILKFMRPILLKDTWMKSASSCHVFHWILSHVKHPHLVEYLPDVFPPPFMFVSYHAIPQQVIGLQCFDHILDNVPPTLIRMNGKEDAIYHAISPLIYSKELPIVHALYPCLLKLPMMRQQRRILSVLDRNLAIADGPEELCRILSLKILKAVIKLCWPRMEYYCLEILDVILKLIYDLEEREDALNEFASDEIYGWCEECLFLLRNACYEKFSELANNYVDEQDRMPGSKLLKSTMVRDT